jgi:hypothetical protein
VITKFPGLVDLQGPARINQTDIESIMGFTGALQLRISTQHQVRLQQHMIKQHHSVSRTVTKASSG